MSIQQQSRLAWQIEAKLALALALFLAASGVARAADTYWQAGGAMAWTDAANWTAGVPLSPIQAHVTNEGTAAISPGDVAVARGLNLGGGFFSPGGGNVVQNGGSLTVTSFYMSAGMPATGGPCTASYYLNDGLLAANYIQIYSVGTHLFEQSGGTVSTGPDGSIYLSAIKFSPTDISHISYYNLNSGDVATTSLVVSGGGDSRFRQLGGRVLGIPASTGQADMRVGLGGAWSGGEYLGTYQLYGPGELTTSTLAIGKAGIFDQTDGAVTVNYLEQKGLYKCLGGTLSPISRGWLLSGTIDFGVNPRVVTVGNGLVDLSLGTIVNGSLTRFVSGPKSLVIVKPGFNTGLFGAGWAPGGLVRNSGSTINVGVNEGFEGWGTINEHVSCGGTIDAGLLADGSNFGLFLANGLNVIGSGSVDLRNGSLTIRDAASGQSGGTLIARQGFIGTTAGAGTFTHTGGTSSIYNLVLGYATGGISAAQGTYYLSGTGVLNVEGLGMGLAAQARFVQSGGTCNVGPGYLYVGQRYQSNYELSGGVLNTTGTYGTVIDGSSSGAATFTHSGGVHNANAFSIGETGSAGGLTATYTLSGTGQLNVTRWEHVGGYRNTTFTQNGGTHVMTGTMGNLTIGGMRNYTTLYSLQSGELEIGSVLSVGGVGSSTFTQTGGTCDVAGELRVAADYDNGDNYRSGLLGTVNLSGNGSFSAGVEKIGHYGVGTFNQTGGTNTVIDDLALADDSRGNGTYNLSGAGSEVSAANCYVGQAGTGKVVQNGGLMDIGGATVLGYEATGVGTYEVGGGTLQTFDLVVGRDNGTSHGSGTFKLNSAAANVVVGGVLHIGQKGTVTAVPGSIIHMTGAAFENYSTTPANLDGLKNLTLIFEGGPATLDPVEVAGRSYGGSGPGFVANFALDTLRVGGSQVGRVQLVDLVDNQPDWAGPEVLYVKHLVLTAGSYLDLNHTTVYYGTLTDLGGTVNLNGGSLRQVATNSTPTLDYNWVYQNIPVTTGNRHGLVLSVTVRSDPLLNTSYQATVTVAPSSAGLVVVEPTANPLVWFIRGGQAGLDPAGAVTLNIVMQGQPHGGQTTLTMPLTVRRLGDLDGLGGLNGQDKLLMNKRLNGLVPDGREYDLDCVGGCNGVDKLILNKLLSGLALP